MSFEITKIEVRDFRSYEHAILEPDEGLTIIVGPNAAGKTNLVEAIQLTTEASSFRKPQWAEVVRWGCERAVVTLTAREGERRHEVVLSVSQSGRRTYSVNGKQKRSVSDVVGIIPCVLFTPEDLRIVKGPAERRREMVDEIGGQLSRTYRRLKTEYDRVVRQRNRLLRSGRPDEEALAPWDERLVALGARLVRHRRNLLDRIVDEAASIYGQMAADGPFQGMYQPSWERDGVTSDRRSEAELLEEHLSLKKEEERVRGVTLSGPHRDEIVFGLDGREARAFGSQGQQRTIALALKLAEVRVVSAVAKARPVLLLDDVMSELDQTRRDSLTEFVGNTAQTVITTTTIGYFSARLLEEAKVVSLT